MNSINLNNILLFEAIIYWYLMIVLVVPYRVFSKSSNTFVIICMFHMKKQLLKTSTFQQIIFKILTFKRLNFFGDVA